MPGTGLTLHIDELYLNHVVPDGHPERADRIGRLLDHRALFELEGVVKVGAGRRATRDDLLMVHTPSHVDRVAATAGQSHASLDVDTPTSELSYETALSAAGGVLDTVDAVMRGDSARGLALVRPPGHHAQTARAMGFCLFNNAAIGARHLIERHGLKRVLVVDWDVHHGNGTQEIFYDDDGVLFASTHQFPLYPGTGARRETGAGRGEGFTVNVPLPPGAGDDDYLVAMRSVVVPVAEQFAPQFVVVSAGFDAHRDDPLAALRVTEAGFAAAASMVMAVADRHCNGRAVAVLEGGYDLDALARSVEAVARVMVGRGVDLSGDASGPAGRETAGEVISPVIEVQSKYWSF